jgi:hypothetical protein
MSPFSYISFFFFKQGERGKTLYRHEREIRWRVRHCIKHFLIARPFIPFLLPHYIFDVTHIRRRT